MSSTCSIPECHEPATIRGFCKRHYRRWRRNTPREVRPPSPRQSGELWNAARAREIFDLTTPRIAYMFGFLQADGTHSAGTGRRGRISLEVSERDRHILAAFQDLVPYRTSINTRTRATNFAAESRTAIWVLCSLEARQRLLELGLTTGRKSRTVAPPQEPYSRPDYLRGLVDADGSIGFTGNGYPFISFTTASQALADHFCREVSEATGVRRSAKRNNRDGIFNILLTTEPAVDLAAWLYYEGCLALKRKHERAVQVTAWRRPATMRARATPRRWTPEEDAVVTSLPVAHAARVLNRTERSVNSRRWHLEEHHRRVPPQDSWQLPPFRLRHLGDLR